MLGVKFVLCIIMRVNLDPDFVEKDEVFDEETNSESVNVSVNTRNEIQIGNTTLI